MGINETPRFGGCEGFFAPKPTAIAVGYVWRAGVAGLDCQQSRGAALPLQIFIRADSRAVGQFMGNSCVYSIPIPI